MAMGLHEGVAEMKVCVFLCGIGGVWRVLWRAWSVWECSGCVCVFWVCIKGVYA